MAEPSTKNTGTFIPTGLTGPAIHVLDRSANCHKKASSPRPTAFETHTMTSQEQLEGSGITREGHSNTQVLAPPFRVVAGGKQCTSESTTTTITCSTTLYRRIKRRVGRSLKQAHCKRNLVPPRKQAAYELFGTKSSLSSLKRVPRPLLRQDSSCCNRQHHLGVIHEQGRRHELGPSLCPTVENFDLVFQETSDSQSPTHSRLAECGSRQAIQVRPDHPDRVVSPSRGFPDNMQQVAPAQNRPTCHEVQQQVAPVCVTSAGSPGLSSGRTAMGRSGRICFPPAAILGKVVEKLQDCPCKRIILITPGWPNMPWFWDLVAMFSQVCPTCPTNSALQSDPSQKSDKPKSPCMAPRASAIEEQGFSEAVAARIETPQRGSTRSIYEAKCTIFTKWCLINQLDFRVPPVKCIADFLLYLFQVRKLQPSTIDG